MNRPTLAALVAIAAALSLGATAVAAESPATPVGAALPPDLVVLPLVDLDLQQRGSRTLLAAGQPRGQPRSRPPGAAPPARRLRR